MQIPFFDLKRTLELVRDELHDALDRTIDNGMFIGGNLVSDFEKQYADYIGVRLGCDWKALCIPLH